MLIKRKSAVQDGDYKRFFSFLELVVAVLVIGFLIAMGTMVWNNIKNKAYDARAQANHRLAEEATLCFWVAVGKKNGSYEGLTADYMNESEPGARWVDAETSLLFVDNMDDIPSDYFASIMIIHDGTTKDEVMVATVSETGKVFCTRFKGEASSSYEELACTDLYVLDGEDLQDDSGSGIDLESDLNNISGV